MQSARLLKKGKQQLEEIKDSESKEIDSKHIENEYSDDESDGDNENFMEDRIEGTGDISKHNLSAHKAPGWSWPRSCQPWHVTSLKRRLEGEQEELAVSSEKPQAERVSRLFGHTWVRKEIFVLDVVVYSKRATDQITFPLHKQDRKLKSVGEDKEWFKAETPLEQQVTDLLAVC